MLAGLSGIAVAKITAFDGDRVMAVFLGSKKNSAAAKAALSIRWIVKYVLNHELERHYKDADYVLKYGVGIDTGEHLSQEQESEVQTTWCG